MNWLYLDFLIKHYEVLEYNYILMDNLLKDFIFSALKNQLAKCPLFRYQYIYFVLNKIF